MLKFRKHKKVCDNTHESEGFYFDSLLPILDSGFVLCLIFGVGNSFANISFKSYLPSFS